MDGESARLDPRRQERRLVKAMLAGDAAAMEDFAERYFPGVYRFALGRLRGDRDLTREIVQTTVCKALAKLASYRGEASLLTWLCACCRNEIAMHYRRRKSLPPHLELEEERALPAESPFPWYGGGPEREAIRREADHLVHLALDLLPPHYAQALEWKYLDRFPVNEIAARLGVGPKAAESLLTRARRAFREEYEQLTHSPEPRSLAACGET